MDGKFTIKKTCSPGLYNKGYFILEA